MTEIASLHAFVLRVAERLYLAAEVLSIRAERRKRPACITFRWGKFKGSQP